MNIKRKMKFNFRGFYVIDEDGEHLNKPTGDFYYGYPLWSYNEVEQMSNIRRKHEKKNETTLE